MNNLYELTTEVLSLMDNEDCTDEALTAAFGDITKKSENVCKYLAVLDANSDMFKKEIERLSARRQAIENHVKRVKEYLLVNMERLEIDSLDAGTFKIKLQDSPPSLVIDNENEIPPECLDIIPLSYKPRKKEIIDALKRGERVASCHLSVGRHLRIR